MAESPEPHEGDSGTRRGRRPVRPDPGSGPVALLAHRLWELKEQAGDPSFAEMSSRLGAAASKSSLAAAARGRALPSWETTWEFVRVLAVDRLGRDAAETEHEWRGHWEQARNADHVGQKTSGAEERRPERDAETPHVRQPPHTGKPPHVRQPPHAGKPPHVRQPPHAGKPPRIRRPAVLVALSAVVAVTAGTLIVVLSPTAGGEESGPRPDVTRTQAAALPRDDSTFEGDVTYPDGTVVKPGARFTKVWRIRNTGATPWYRRYLTQIDGGPCHAPRRVPIPSTAPGESVDIAVRVRAADAPGRCKIYWKMTNEDGAPMFAGKRPIFLDVTVK